MDYNQSGLAERIDVARILQGDIRRDLAEKTGIDPSVVVFEIPPSQVSNDETRRCVERLKKYDKKFLATIASIG